MEKKKKKGILLGVFMMVYLFKMVGRKQGVARDGEMEL